MSPLSSTNCLHVHLNLCRAQVKHCLRNVLLYRYTISLSSTNWSSPVIQKAQARNTATQSLKALYVLLFNQNRKPLKNNETVAITAQAYDCVSPAGNSQKTWGIYLFLHRNRWLGFTAPGHLLSCSFVPLQETNTARFSACCEQANSKRAKNFGMKMLWNDFWQELLGSWEEREQPCAVCVRRRRVGGGGGGDGRGKEKWSASRGVSRYI